MMRATAAIDKLKIQRLKKNIEEKNMKINIYSQQHQKEKRAL